jgi:hypothetical protein
MQEKNGARISTAVVIKKSTTVLNSGALPYLNFYSDFKLFEGLINAARIAW